MKTCPYCAEEIQEAAVVCKHCGRELPRPAATVKVSPRAQLKKDVRIVLLAGVTTVVICGVLIWLLIRVF